MKSLSIKFFLKTIFFFCIAVQVSFAQVIDDGNVAQQYVAWLQRAIDEGRMDDAAAALPRIGGFSNVSSDIAFLMAFVHSQTGKDRQSIVTILDTAIQVNRWVSYNENMALILKAEQLIAMRRYTTAISTLDQIRSSAVSSVMQPLSAEVAMLRLEAFRGLAANTASTSDLSAFRSLALSTINMYPRDPRPVKIFLEYAHNVRYRRSHSRPLAAGNQWSDVQMPAGDQRILDHILLQLPFIVERDSELAWLAAPFMHNLDEARRYVAGYRAGGFSPNERIGQESLNLHSIPIALNLGLISDTKAVEELFFYDGFSPLISDVDVVRPRQFINLEALTETYRLLRSEQGRDAFTQALYFFIGYIISDDDNDGIIDTLAYYDAGVIKNFSFDKNQENTFDILFNFDSNGVPYSAMLPLTGSSSQAAVRWERYPNVEQVSLLDEKFNFRSAYFLYAPVSFIVIGGSRTRAGIPYPVLTNNTELTRKTLVSFCSNIERPSVEFKGATEYIYLSNSIPLRASEYMGSNLVSITEFERGIPVIQYIDVDMDGRMETIRRFHSPGSNYPWPDPEQRFDYRRLIASSESDWTGDGRYMTGEVYHQDGSVVYLWDIDGSGTMDYNETQR